MIAQPPTEIDTRLVRGFLALLPALATAFVVAAAAGAARGGESAIQPGTGIGKVRLGMTPAQIRAALGGRHQTVNNARTLRTGGRYVELGWEKPGRVRWDPYLWTIGFQSSSRNGKLRAVRVASSDPREKTPDGLGVGSRVRDVVRAHPDVACLGRTTQWRGAWIVVRQRNGGMTAFGIGSGSETNWTIDRVLVQHSWFPFGDDTGFECDPGWRER